MILPVMVFFPMERISCTVKAAVRCSFACFCRDCSSFSFFSMAACVLFTHGLYSAEKAPKSMFCHLLQHLERNNRMVGLLCGENGDLFQRYFKESLNELVKTQVLPEGGSGIPGLPTDFLVNHISGSFVEMVLWWLKGNRQYTPEELDRYFSAVIRPVLAEQKRTGGETTARQQNCQ